MLEGTFARLLDRYGERVAVYPKGGGEGTVGRAFLQPVLERREDWRQAQPTPLGVIRRDRFLYLGEAGLPLEGGGAVERRGTRYGIQTAQAVYLGGAVSHWWAVLRVREGETA